MNCGTCRFWETDDHHMGRLPESFGVCERSTEAGLPAVGWVEGSDNTYVPVMRDKNLRMYAQDGSDYWAALITRSDFGCLDYEERASA